MKRIKLSIFFLVCFCQALMATEPYAVLTGSGTNKTLTFYYGTKPANALDIAERYSSVSERAWDPDTMTIQKVVFNASFAQYRPTETWCWFYNMKTLKVVEGMENLNTSNVTDMGWMFSGCSSLLYLDVSYFNTGNVRSMREMFNECSSLTSLDVSGFDTRNVEDMTAMFRMCEGLETIDVTGFNTSKVKYMGWMFCGCSALKSVDVSNFDTGNVEIMTSMFWYCYNLKSIDVSHFNTSKVTDMGGMFFVCDQLQSLDVSNFDTYNVENMAYMFYYCEALTFLDLSHFETSNVKDMSYMFIGCINLKSLNLLNFNTEKVTDMTSMFRFCYTLRNIYVGDKWSTENVTNGNYMFMNCNYLVGGKGTYYDGNHEDVAYAHIDGGTSNPGYLTDGSASPKDGTVAEGLYPLGINMFYSWDGCTDSSNMRGLPRYKEIHKGEQLNAGDTGYGFGAVFYTDYADLTAYDSLIVVGTPGMQLRGLFNRLEVGNGGGDEHGGAVTELNIELDNNGIGVFSFSDFDFVHLNAIKVGWESPAGIIDDFWLAKGKISKSMLGIQQPVAERNTHEQYYDLQGRRIDKPARGLNIICKGGGKTVKVMK